MSLPLTQSSKYTNIWYGYEVTPIFKERIEIILKLYPQYQHKQTEIHGLQNNIFIDTYSRVYEYTGLLTYYINHTSFLSVAAMFESIQISQKNNLLRANILLPNTGWDLVYIYTIHKMPKIYLTSFADIPFCETLDTIDLTPDQQEFLQTLSKDMYDRGSIKLESFERMLKKDLPPCSLNNILNGTPEFIYSKEVSAIIDNNEEFKSKITTILEQIYTKYLLSEIDISKVTFTYSISYTENIEICAIKRNMQIYLELA